mmetsp:Transcript_9257/g.13940  ORF Transcript_9257/g.13940 Transcript_9257/m.13940 type:complete len:146 (-) Transcript_9257:45-482(-)|eukprot:CAMPEP_0185026140 /NCGR_PEP_ID=MMETSP1103-20130426/10114_1 /TAXON_ID=36769 /ORGANISM="Paraphysomonas bandaiensis, Strain Caron Lab Isolate" /LENGTH=145 /DNA_ID=CAMNT_0027559629 /DNA_START=35 /DNA_END=472 /DNA_ORIENTATION=-
MSSNHEFIDLTVPSSVTGKRQIESISSATTTAPPPAAITSRPATTTAPRAATTAPAAKRVPKKVPKKDTPHVLLWICGAGKGQGRNWKQKSLRVIGVYGTKEAAENKKITLMERYECCGHGDICVGDTWEDEIDLVVRPVEEMAV